MDLAIWQNGLEKQVKSIRQNTQENILYDTPKQIYHFCGGIIINRDAFIQLHNSLLKDS